MDSARMGRITTVMQRWIPILFLATACGGAGNPPAGHAPQPALQTVDGEVIRVNSNSPEDSLATGMRIVIRPDGRKPIDVELAPGWYLGERGLHFASGDRVRVQGAASNDRFVASKVSKGRREVPLRDDAGRPLWKATPERRK